MEQKNPKPTDTPIQTQDDSPTLPTGQSRISEMVPYIANCAVCQAPIPTEVERAALQFGDLTRRLMAIIICDQCRADRDAEADRSAAAKLLSDRKDQWNRICPEIYRDFDLVQSRHPEASERIIQWNPREGRGLLVVGASRAGKTRAVYQMLRRKFMEGAKVSAFRGTKWTELAIAKARGGDESPEARRLIAEAHSADLTFVDDFAKNRWTETTEVAFWELLEDRGSRRKPVILTCTETGDAMIQRMGHSGQDIINRLREFCDVIKF